MLAPGMLMRPSALLPPAPPRPPDVTPAQVSERFPTMAGRLRQTLTNWRNNNPGQHAEYAAEHALSTNHHHAEDLLAALARTGPGDVLRMAARLRGAAAAAAPSGDEGHRGGGSSGGGGAGAGGAKAGGGQLHVDMIVYGNAEAAEALALASTARASLRPTGLHPCLWRAARALDLSPSVWPLASPGWLGAPLAAAQPAQQPASRAGGCPGADAAWVGGGRALEGGRQGVSVTYAPANPNPANKNHAVYFVLQVNTWGGIGAFTSWGRPRGLCTAPGAPPLAP
jgi:hypothetical protein